MKSKLVQQLEVIESFVDREPTLTGEALREFTWITKAVARLKRHHERDQKVRFYFLYGRLEAATLTFIQRYVPSELRP